MSIEAAISNNGYGGDFMLDDTGDLVLSEDTFDNDAATQERIIRLLFTTPRLLVNGAPIGEPDCEQYPDWGVGLPALVDENASLDLQDEITSQILNGLTSDPGVASDPAPTISYTLTGTTVAVVVSYTRLNGQTTTLPSITLSTTGG